MKKIWVWFIFSVLLCCLTPLNLLADTKIKVGIYQNIPLTFIDEEGKIKGFFIDILEAVAKKEGWKIQYVPDSWPQCLKNLADGKIDLLGVIAYSPERAKLYDYSYENVQSEWAQVYTHNKSGIDSVLDLKFRKIAVLREDIHFINLRDMVNSFGFQARFIEAFEYETVLELVENGRCDAGVVSHNYGMQYEDQYNIHKSPIIFNPQKLYIAVPKGVNRELLDKFDWRLRDLKNAKKSVYYQSMNKWFGAGSGWDIPQWLIWITISIAGLLFIFLTTSVILRNRIKAKTQELSEKNIELVAEIEQRRQAEMDRRKLEAQLQRAQKMEAIGTLAGGVAHDLNNILSGLVSYPELLLMDVPLDSPLRKPILTIQKSGVKAANIVHDMLTMARRGVAVTEVVNLNHIISDYLKTPEFEKLKMDHHHIQIETHLAEKLLNILGSPVHLSKTVMNLISNAAEAMPNAGTIIISTKNSYIDKPVSGYDDIDEGDYVILTISDTGIGISPDDINRIFEPFYTKKVMGRSGTGLGMAVVWGTVKDHNGYIDIESSESSGTTLRLFFPVTRQLLAHETSEISIEDYMGFGESVLVVDDIEEQREIASGMLTKLGYSVTAVSSGEKAVRYMEKNSADLLILDMIMDPGMDGLETYRSILEQHPKQKAVIASGFSETERVKEAQKLGAGQYVKKPYTLEKIAMAVRTELDRSI